MKLERLIGMGVLALLFAVGLFFSCAKKLPQYPVTYNAQIISSLDPETVLVRAVGEWENNDGAIVEAKLNAMWIVIQNLAQTEQEKLKVEANKEAIYKDMDRYVTLQGTPRATRTPQGKYRVEANAVVRKKLLEDFLSSAGYIQKREEVIEALENPSIVVIPHETAKGQAWIDFAISEANSYFTTRKFEVLNPDTVEQLYKMAEQIEMVEGLPQDPAAKIALSIGGDIYITVEGKFEEGRVGSDKTVKSAVSLKAYETTTGRLIGSSTGFSKELVAGPGKDRVTISEAVRDAVDKVITQIMDYWKSDLKKGKQFLVFIYGNFGDLERQKKLSDSIKAISSEYKRETVTSKLMTFRIWYKGQSDELLFALQDELKKQGLAIKPKVQNRKMLQFQVE